MRDSLSSRYGSNFEAFYILIETGNRSDERFFLYGRNGSQNSVRIDISYYFGFFRKELAYFVVNSIRRVDTYFVRLI